MDPITVVTGSMMPLDRADVDSDQIMPKQFLKRVERTGFGEFIFHDWRHDPGFVLNDGAYADATMLVSGPNFGCGSSREHAPWGLQQHGFLAVVAPSFADIFAANCARTGLLAIALEPQVCTELIARSTRWPSTRATIDLTSMRFECGDISAVVKLDPHHLRMLTQGLDEVQVTLEREDEIMAYESSRVPWVPVTTALEALDG